MKTSILFLVFLLGAGAAQASEPEFLVDVSTEQWAADTCDYYFAYYRDKDEKVWSVCVSTSIPAAKIIPANYQPTRKDFEQLAIMAATSIRDQEKLLKRKDSK